MFGSSTSTPKENPWREPGNGLNPVELTWSERLPRIITRASIIGIGVSLLIHVFLALVTGMVRWGGGGGGGEPGVYSPIEMAVITQTELSALEDAPISSLTPGVDEVKPDAAELSATPSMDMNAGGQATPGTGDLGGIGSGLGGAGTGEGIGIGDGAGGAGGGGTKFFGVEARGSRFVYVVDISGSMGQSGKLEFLKEQLIGSISGLLDNGAFSVICFSSTAVPLMQKERWSEANDRNKQEAFKAIRTLVADGGTNPTPAFVIAMKLRPKPDAIYFMTDGLFDDEVADQVAAMNRGTLKIPVHCISFMDRSSEPLMRKMARDSGGTYTHVEAARK